MTTLAALIAYAVAALALCAYATHPPKLPRWPRLAWAWFMLPRLTDGQAFWCMAALLGAVFAVIGVWEMGIKK